MRAVVYLAARELRARWQSWVVLVVLVAAAGGAVLAAAAGASRTQSAYPRFLMASKASDVFVAPYFPGPPGYVGALARLAGVREVAPFVLLNLQPLGHGSWAARVSSTVAPVDGRQRLDVPKVLAGRLPAADRAGEIAVDHRGAAMMGLRVGSVLTMRALPNGLLPGARPSQHPARPRLLRERLVGIVVTRGSVLPVNELDKVPLMLASPALFHRLGVRYLGAAGAYVKLRPGASAEAFGRRAQSLTRRFPATGDGAAVADEGEHAAAVQRAIQPEAITLALFALVLGLTALLIVGQVATRLLATSSLDTPALAALGLTRRQLMAAGLIKVGVAAAIGAAVAAGVAVAASPLMPIGAARLAEPDPGVSADALVLAAGAAAIVVLLVAWAAWPAWRLTSIGTRRDSTSPAPGRWPRLTGWLAGAGVPVTASPAPHCRCSP
jgi:putative ABC transport system permease protein